MNVQALRLPALLPALPMVEERTEVSYEWHHQGMPRDRVVFVGYEATRHSRNYGADGKAMKEKEGRGTVIDIYV